MCVVVVAEKIDTNGDTPLTNRRLAPPNSEIKTITGEIFVVFTDRRGRARLTDVTRVRIRSPSSEWRAFGGLRSSREGAGMRSADGFVAHYF